MSGGLSNPNLLDLFDRQDSGRGRRNSNFDDDLRERSAADDGRRESVQEYLSPGSRRNRSITDDVAIAPDVVHLVGVQTSPGYGLDEPFGPNQPPPLQWEERDPYNPDSNGSRRQMLSPHEQPRPVHSRTRTAQDYIEDILEDVSSQRVQRQAVSNRGRSMGGVMDIQDQVKDFFMAGDADINPADRADERQARIEAARRRKSKAEKTHQKSRSMFAGAPAPDLGDFRSERRERQDSLGRSGSRDEGGDFDSALQEMFSPAAGHGTRQRGSRTTEDFEITEDQPVLHPPDARSNAIQLINVENDQPVLHPPDASGPIRGRRDSLASSQGRRKSISSQNRRQSFTQRRKSLSGSSRRGSMSSSRRRNSLLGPAGGGSHRRNMSATSGISGSGGGRRNLSVMSITDLAAVMGHEDEYDEEANVNLGALGELFTNEDGTSMSVDEVMAAIEQLHFQMDEYKNQIQDLLDELEDKDQTIQRYEAELQSNRMEGSNLESQMRSLKMQNKVLRHDAMESKDELHNKMTQLNGEILALKEKLRNQKADIKLEERGDLEEMQIKMTDYEIDNRKLEKELQRLQDQVGRSREEATEMKIENRELEMTRNSLQIDLRNTKEALRVESNQRKELERNAVMSEQKAKQIQQENTYLNDIVNEFGEHDAQIKSITNLQNIQQEGSASAHIPPEYLQKPGPKGSLAAALGSGILMLPEEVTEMDSDSETHSSRYFASASDTSEESSMPPTPKEADHARTRSQLSLLTMPVHDGMREFFYLLAFCVKMKLSRLFGVTPDLTPPTHVLWKRAHQQKVMFHDYHDWLTEKISEVYGSWREEEGAMPTHGRVTIPGGPHPIHDDDLDYVYTTPARPPSPEHFGYAGFEEMEALDLGNDPIMPSSIPTDPKPLYTSRPGSPSLRTLKRKKRTKKKKKREKRSKKNKSSRRRDR